MSKKVTRYKNRINAISKEYIHLSYKNKLATIPDYIALDEDEAKIAFDIWMHAKQNCNFRYKYRRRIK